MCVSPIDVYAVIPSVYSVLNICLDVAWELIISAGEDTCRRAIVEPLDRSVQGIFRITVTVFTNVVIVNSKSLYSYKT